MPMYVDDLTTLLDTVQPKLPRGASIEVKRFFGGAAAFVDGCIFMSLTKVGVAIKLPEADREWLFSSKRAKKLRYSPNAPIKKPFMIREGGSLPILPMFKKIIGAETLMIGLCWPNCNAHGPNEFFHRDDFQGGIRTSAHFAANLKTTG